MKKMKWIVAAAFSIVSLTAFAQTEAPKSHDHKQHAQHEHQGQKHHNKKAVQLKEYQAKLNLSPEQLSEWQDLQAANKQNRKALKANTSLSADEKKAQMKEMRQQNQVALEKILSEEQYAQYKEIRKENMQARKEHGHKKGGIKRGSRK